MFFRCTSQPKSWIVVFSSVGRCRKSKVTRSPCTVSVGVETRRLLSLTWLRSPVSGSLSPSLPFVERSLLVKIEKRGVDGRIGRSRQWTWLHRLRVCLPHSHPHRLVHSSLFLPGRRFGRSFYSWTVFGNNDTFRIRSYKCTVPNDVNYIDRRRLLVYELRSKSKVMINRNVLILFPLYDCDLITIIYTLRSVNKSWIVVTIISLT